MRYFEVTAADTSVMSQIRDHGEKFVQPCSAGLHGHPTATRTKTIIQFEQSRYTDTHTLDLNRENHRKRK